eukprot:TRINITY_DN10488_c0_g1_i1.p1 TRINITY_DN10488_c0_g1~~TRINITY_DN10488_c0_g1_i1.p1  ORF type:complete len:652 (+),score=201.66 TRINITY_DN10488_c0_g1_i1:146-2101(+)
MAATAHQPTYGRRTGRTTTSTSRSRTAMIPSIIEDKQSGAQYIRGSFLGKGGFAQCYKLTDSVTKKVYAGKIVAKSTLTKHRAKEKLKTEIQIHRSLHHQYIVGFHSFFEDSDNVYILLELCSNQSMMELHKRRRGMSEPEARWFLLQIAEATSYMHQRKVIHRDLKLGNLFLNDRMEVKVGDYGLATTISYDGERKKTLCGTPNYIAPEILEGRSGHSYEVDIWSIGCILYTMLVGKPPFETRDIKTTYSKIKRNDYRIPSSLNLSPEAQDLIRMLLHRDPAQRPKVDEILLHPFLAGAAYVPSEMPVKALHVVPDFNSIPAAERPAATYRAHGASSSHSHHAPLPSKKKETGHTRTPFSPLNNKNVLNPTSHKASSALSKPASTAAAAPTVAWSVATDAAPRATTPVHAGNERLRALGKRLLKVTSQQATVTTERKPALAPSDEARRSHTISKWVDYSYKYGLGYQLSDGSVGVLFNDNTKMVLAADMENVEFTEREKKGGATQYMQLSTYPESMTKKITLLKYFRDYMKDNLQDGPSALRHKQADYERGLPFVKKWLRTKHAIVFRLNIGVVQINFFDHTKLVVNGPRDTVTYIDSDGSTRIYILEEIMKSKHASIETMMARLSYATDVIDHMLTKSRSSSPRGETRA